MVIECFLGFADVFGDFLKALVQWVAVFVVRIEFEALPNFHQGLLCLAQLVVERGQLVVALSVVVGQLGHGLDVGDGVDHVAQAKVRVGSHLP